MSNKAVGLSFCGLSVALFLSRYMIVAKMMFGAGNTVSRYKELMEAVGPLPWVLSALCLAAGVFYLLQDRNKQG